MSYEFGLHSTDEGQWRLGTAVPQRVGESLQATRLVDGISATELVRRSVSYYSFCAEGVLSMGGLIIAEAPKKLENVRIDDLGLAEGDNERMRLSVNVSDKVAKVVQADQEKYGLDLDDYTTRCLRLYDRLRGHFVLGSAVRLAYPGNKSINLRDFQAEPKT